MSRLSIELSAEQHKQIKALAALQGKSIKELVLDKIFNNQADEDSAWKELMSFLDKRIQEAHNSTPITTSFKDIIEKHQNKVK